MSLTPTEHNPNNVRRSGYIVISIILLIMLHMIIFFSSSHRELHLNDVDSYMRLYQVLELHETGNWYDSIYHRSNAPYGELRQWTRPLDVILYAGASLLSLKLDFKSALFFWGWIIGPILHIIALVAIFWAVRPFLSTEAHSYLGFLFICQIGIFSYFVPGDADHHHILLLFFILSTGYIIRLLITPFRVGVCLAAGAITAIYIWISTEAMLPLLMNLLALGFLWIKEKRDYVQKGFLFSLSLFVTTAVALALERPWYDWTLMEVDRISLIHFGLFGIITLFWWGMKFFDGLRSGKQLLKRFIVAFTGTVLTGLAMWIFFPKFFRGPFAYINPEVRKLLLRNSLLMQPMTSVPHFLPTFILFLGFAIPVLAFTIYMLWRKRREDYEGWLYLTIGFVIFLPISLYQMRWTAYAEVLLVIPMAELVCCIMKKEESFLKDFWKPWGRALTIFFFCTFNILLYSRVSASSKLSEGPLPIKQVPMSRICNYLNHYEKHPMRVLTFFFLGPEILFRTHHEVIGTPDHRNAQGILDSYRIESATQDQEAFRLIRKRKINLILLCPRTGEESLLASSGRASTLYRRLEQGKVPGWLRKVNLPKDLSTSFLLFKVVYQ